MKNLLFPIALLFLILNLVGCSNSDNDAGSANKSFRAQIDGENFTAREDLIFALGINGNYLSIGGTNDNITNTKTIDFTIESATPNSLSVGLEITDSNQNFDVLANYADFDEDIDAWSDEPGGSYFIKITSIDYDKEIVSGEFEFTVIDDDLNKSFKITKGVFTNIPF